MATSSDAIERVKHVGGEPVTWKGLLQTGLVMGSLAVGIGGCIYSKDAEHEASQTSEIRSKAERSDVRELLNEIHLLRGWIERMVRIAEAQIGQEQQFIGQVQGQNQEQSVHVTDWRTEALKEDFLARRQQQMLRDFGPCVISSEEQFDVVRRSGDAEGARTPSVSRGGGQPDG